MRHIAPRGREQATPALDQFADLLAQEVSPPDAAEMLGHNRPYGRRLLHKLRNRLGEQAI